MGVPTRLGQPVLRRALVWLRGYVVKWGGANPAICVSRGQVSRETGDGRREVGPSPDGCVADGGRSLTVAAAYYPTIVASTVSLQGPFSSRLLTQRSM